MEKLLFNKWNITFSSSFRNNRLNNNIIFGNSSFKLIFVYLFIIS